MKLDRQGQEKLCSMLYEIDQAWAAPPRYEQNLHLCDNTKIDSDSTRSISVSSNCAMHL